MEREGGGMFSGLFGEVVVLGVNLYSGEFVAFVVVGNAVVVGSCVR